MNDFQSLPVTHNVLAKWIAFELESNKITTVKQYVSVLRSKHIDKGLPVTVFSELSIARIFTGARCLHGTPPIRERREITKDILLQMLTHIDSSSFNGLNIYTAFCVAFAGFLRPGKLTWDTWDHAKSHASHICRNQSTSQPTASSYTSRSPRVINLAKGQTSRYRSQMTLLAQSRPSAISLTCTCLLLLTLYSRASLAPSTNAGLLKISNLPSSKPELPTLANTQVIPSVKALQIPQYQRDSPSMTSRPLADGSLMQQNYISQRNLQTPSTLPSTNGFINNTLSFTWHPLDRKAP